MEYHPRRETNSEINTSIGNVSRLPEIEIVKGQNNSNSDMENDSLDISEITIKKNTNSKRKSSNNQMKQLLKDKRNQHLNNPRTQSINN